MTYHYNNVLALIAAFVLTTAMLAPAIDVPANASTFPVEIA